MIKNELIYLKTQNAKCVCGVCLCVQPVGSGGERGGVWIISPQVVFREVSQAWGEEEKGDIVVVETSVRGASENRFSHGGLTETHLQQLHGPTDYMTALQPLLQQWRA